HYTTGSPRIKRFDLEKPALGLPASSEGPCSSLPIGHFVGLSGATLTQIAFGRIIDNLREKIEEIIETS
ncbi:MAG: hypothetical protein WEB30_06860, partial [Cyclobacteriaceae bacterium]